MFAGSFRFRKFFFGDIIMKQLVAAVMLTGLPFVVGVSQANAESNYLSDSLTFEQWCAERYDDERCAVKDERDVREYERSIKNLEAIETQYNIEQRKEQEFRDRYESQDNIEPSNRVDTRSPPPQ